MTKTFHIYRSSAGSGKTRMLAKEYLMLALAHRSHYFRHILAVTFTNKSTQEMKDRILEYLNDFSTGRKNELTEELKGELNLDENTFRERSEEVQRSILHQYHHFSISTIDAFFQKVIRSFTRESGLMGDYRLEVEEDLVLQDVIGQLIDELGRNKELTEWVVEFARENLENERAWDVRNSLVNFSKKIFKEEFRVIEDDVLNRTNSNLFFKELKFKLGQTRSHFLSKVSNPATEAVRIINERGWDLSEIKGGKTSGLFNFFANFARIKGIAGGPVPGSKVRGEFNFETNWPSKTTRRASEIKQVAKDQLIPLLQEIISAYDQFYEQALSAELVLRNLYVFGLIADITRKLKDYKEQHNLMLLADAPKFLNKIINESDTPFIYEKVGSFYRNFLIDEFQDTSGFQWKNFSPLITNGLDQGNHSFVVGDVKQAIYRWRGGNLTLLQNQIENEVRKERVEIKNLTTNYRSAPELVTFNNVFFKAAAAKVSEKTGDIAPITAFNEVEQKAFRTNLEGFVQIQFLEDTEEEDWLDLAFEKIPQQLELLQSNDVRLSDIAILVRKKDEGHKVAAYLLNYKNSSEAKPGCRYDVISDESLRLDGAASVNLLLSAMKYLYNPDDAIARAQLGYEVARLKEPERKLEDVFPVSKQVIFESNLPEEFTHSKAWLKKLPLFELSETLIEIFNIGDFPGELTYLQAFQDAVLDFNSREKNDLGAFLEWWEEMKTELSIKVPGEVDAIQIMTIHKAKGLQFKFVMVPFCWWNMDHDGFKAPLLWVKSEESIFKEAGHLPVEYSSKMKESYFRSFYQEELVKTYLDNLNLLYVAFTRAEVGLFIMAPLPGNKSVRTTNHAGKILHECLTSDDNLIQYWTTEFLEWRVGEIKKAVQLKSEGVSTISLTHYPAGRWREKLIIKKSSTVRGEEMDEDQRQKIKYGLYLHAVLSRIKYRDEVAAALQAIVNEGLILEEEKSSLNDQLEQLFNQEQISGWFNRPWEVRTEVPVLLPGGEEHRIDRLMINGKKAVVVDFKTGEHHRQDQKQVQNYMNTLQKMNFEEVEGFLLYVKDREVVSVKGEKIKSLKKKDDKDQLSLDLQ